MILLTRYMKNKKIILAFFILLLLVVLFYVWLSPMKKPEVGVPSPYTVIQEVPKGQNTWQGVTPGVTSSLSAAQSFGTVINSIELTNGYISTKYDWKGKYLPLEVVTDTKNVVQFIKIPQFGTNIPLFEEYVRTQGLGTPSFEMYVKDAYRLKAYVFLDKGAVIEAGEYSRFIEAIDYFVPTDKATFLQKWGSNLVEEYVPLGN